MKNNRQNLKRIYDPQYFINGKPPWKAQKYENWEHLTNYILTRDNHTCQECKKPGTLAHHIDNNPYNNDTKNLKCLCLNCNGLNKHKKKRKK